MFERRRFAKANRAVLALVAMMFGSFCISAAVAQSGSVSAQVKDSFYPITERSWWKYKKTVKSCEGKIKTTFFKDEILPATSQEAKSAPKIGGVRPIVLKKTSDDAKENNLVFFTVKDGWISQVGTKTCSYSSPMRILPLKPKPLQKWKDKGTGKGSTPDMNFTMEFENDVWLLPQKNPNLLTRKIGGQEDTYKKSVGLIKSRATEYFYQDSPPQTTDVELVDSKVY